MFYCEECREKKDWPKSFATSFGRCEICETSKACYDTPSRNLPKPSGGPVRKYPGFPGGPPVMRPVPVIPPIQPTPQPLDPNPVVAQCGACGLELHQVMNYSCPRSDCPCFPKAVC